MPKHSKPIVRRIPVRSILFNGIICVAVLGILWSLMPLGTRALLWIAGLQQPQAGFEYLKDSLTHANSPSSPEGNVDSYIDDNKQEQTPFDEPAEETFIIPAEKGDGGKVSEQQLTSGSTFVNGVAIRNRSDNQTLSLETEAAIPPSLLIENTDAPQVLIVHTHTTETYMPYYAGYYNDGDSPRSTDETLNVCAVGKAITAQLQAAGIGVIHDTAVHDYPRYTGAYTRSADTVAKNLEKYPSIKVILDVHRDGIMSDETTKVKPTAVVNGKKAAQMMLVMGVVDSKDVPHPAWRENLHFAMALQSRLHTAYPGVIRPISCVSSRYNQHMSPAYILIEMGSEANTLGEAIYSGQLLGKELGVLLNSLKETVN
ncbi:MAG: hypothetical protein E7534_03980 [Ruminococcaceae bacterium]|nr:hypothetical protein [Oscillospiraceae bacterium]